MNTYSDKRRAGFQVHYNPHVTPEVSTTAIFYSTSDSIWLSLLISFTMSMASLKIHFYSEGEMELQLFILDKRRHYCNKRVYNTRFY